MLIHYHKCTLTCSGWNTACGLDSKLKSDLPTDEWPDVTCMDCLAAQLVEDNANTFQFKASNYAIPQAYSYTAPNWSVTGSGVFVDLGSNYYTSTDFKKTPL